MKLVLLCFSIVLLLAACMGDKHISQPTGQKLYEAVAAKYPGEKTTLIFVDAPPGFVAEHFASNAVETGANAGRATAIASMLALKNGVVIVAGNNEAFTATTFRKALLIGSNNISGGKAAVIGSRESKQAIEAAAKFANVNVDFIDSPQ